MVLVIAWVNQNSNRVYQEAIVATQMVGFITSVIILIVSTSVIILIVNTSPGRYPAMVAIRWSA